MADLKSICPVCDQDIVIPERSIVVAVMHKDTTEGKALVGCPNCCRILVLPSDIPTDGVALNAWIAKYDTEAETNWLQCAKLLDDMHAKLPNGFVEHIGVRYWTPGDDTQSISTSNYILRYGINPVCAWAKRGK
jgi:hypothetical protein